MSSKSQPQLDSPQDDVENLARMAAEKEEQLRLNKERVLFTKPVVKHIVSPHSGSILASPEPVIPLEIDVVEKCAKAFESIGVDGTVSKQKIPELLSKSGFEHDLQLLTKVVQEFYTSSSDQVEATEYLEFVGRFYAPAYHFGERLRKNVARGQTDEVTKLLVRNCNVNTSDGEGTSSLHYCCEFNRSDIIELLAKIAKKGLAVNAQDRYGWTPLHSAAHQGNKSCVALLIKLGAKVNMVNSVGKSPLHTAASQNRGAIADLFLAAKADLNLQDKVGMTPLHEAAFRGHTTLFNELSLHPTANLKIKDILGNVPSNYLDDPK